VGIKGSSFFDEDEEESSEEGEGVCWWSTAAIAGSESRENLPEISGKMRDFLPLTDGNDVDVRSLGGGPHDQAVRNSSSSSSSGGSIAM
jgi:hypothetical protein